MTRPARALIDLGALRHNYQLARRLQGGRALAVIKANAYGHGATRCAMALADIADGYAVAFAQEAIELRASGISGPILLLEGCFDDEELLQAQQLGLWIVVHQSEQISMIERMRLAPRSLTVWLKINTGMHRAGFDPAEVKAAHARLKNCGSVDSITHMTHFARSDEPDHDATTQQLHTFDQTVAGLPGEQSVANSGAVLAWPDARRDWARPGIVLYGADPMPGESSGLIPVMSLQSRIFNIRMLQTGDALGYGATFIADKPTRVGLVAIGYADGYPRSAPTGTPVMIDGRLSRTIGRVSMDMMTVDLTDLPQTGVGSEVELWGRNISVNRVAQSAGTISYELLCNVKRVPRVYTNEAP